MFLKRLQNKIRKIHSSIIAIGFFPEPGKVKIIGSGFCIDKKHGKFITAAHLWNKLNSQQKENLQAFVMVESVEKRGLERYTWMPIKILSVDLNFDLSIIQLKEIKKNLLVDLALGDSEKVKVGDEVYFIGFPYAAELMNDGLGVTLLINTGIINNIKRNESDVKILLFVDAISNPGNSGCPLIDKKTNKVIGIMTRSFGMKSKAVPLFEFRIPMHVAAAVPINLVKDLLI